MSIKSANKPQAAELLPPPTAEKASVMSSGIVPSSTTSAFSSAVGAVCTPMQNVLVYVGNDNYAHAYTVNNTPAPPHNAAAPGPYQLHQQQRQNHHHHHQPCGPGGGCGTAKFYPSDLTYLQQHNGYKPLLTATDQNNLLVRYNTSDYVTVHNNNNNSNQHHIVVNRCDSVKSEATKSSCSSLSSPESDRHLLMGTDSNQGNTNSGSAVTVTSSASGLVPILATVAPPVQAQPPLGTAVGIGGNVAAGTATVSVPGAGLPVLGSIGNNIVSVPHGWQRLVSNDAIIYVSPSNTVLATSDQAKDYLQTTGTCKCGLECPFHFDSTFNFDVKVVGKPSLLTPDINVDLTKLCNHKRKLQSSMSAEAKMIEPLNNQNVHGSQKKKSKVSNNKKIVKVTTATSTMPPYHSPGTATADAIVANNNAGALLHPLDSNLCSTSAGNTLGGPQFAQQHQQQLWPNQMNGSVMTPSIAQRLAHPPSMQQQQQQIFFSNNVDATQSYYGYPPQQQMLPPQIYPQPPLPMQGRLNQPSISSGGYSVGPNTGGGDLTSQLHISGVTTANPNCQMVPPGLANCSNGSGIGLIGSQNLNINGNHFLSGPPPVEQSGPGRPPTNLPHHPNNIRLPHPMCYEPTGTTATSKQHQTSGIRLPVPYPNMPQHPAGIRLPKQTSSWNFGLPCGGGGMMKRSVQPLQHQQQQQQQQHNDIYDRVPPLPQHLTGTSGAIQNCWAEDVNSVRKKPPSKTNSTRTQKKPRSNYHILIDPQHQQPCPNVDVRQMTGQTLQQQQQEQQQKSFNAITNSLENCATNSMIATASPSFIDDPSGYLAQQTALLNSTISGQGLQMNGFLCNTPPPLTHSDAIRPSGPTASTTAIASKQPPPSYQHHRTPSKQQQHHFSGGQVFISQQQQQQIQPHQQLHQVIVNGGVVVTTESQLENNVKGPCTDCLIGSQDDRTPPQQQQVMGSKRSYSRVGRGEAAVTCVNEDPVTSSTFFDHPLSNTPTCSLTSSSKNTNSTTSSNTGSRSQCRPLQLPSVSSPDSRPIQGGTISTSNVSPLHDTCSNNSVSNISGVASPPQQQQIILSKLATSQHGVLNSTTPRLCITSMAPNIANIASGVRTLQSQPLPIITSPTITLTSRPGITQQLSQQFQLTTSAPQQHQQQLQHQQLLALATAVTSANMCANGTTAVVVSSGANGTLVAKSPLEMVQSVVIKSPSNHHPPNTLAPGHILVSSGGQLLMASTAGPVSTAQQHQQHAVAQAVAQVTQQHHLMAPPPPKQQLGMPPISVSPMVTNVTASVTQVIPTVAQQVLGQQTVLVNALPTPSFLLQPGVTMTMDGLANLQNLQQIPHLLTANNLLQQHQPNQVAAAATAALLSPTQDIFSALAKTNNGAASPGSAVTANVTNVKKGKKRKFAGGPLVPTSNNQSAVANMAAGLVAQPVTSMLHITAAGNGTAGVVSPQSFAPQLQMHSPQTPVMQALTIVPGKAGGPPQLVMNTSPAQATTQHINLLQPVNLLNNSTGVHIQNYPTIQQFILPNLGGMVVNADGTATILPATTTTSPAQATADAAAHVHAHPLQMQLQLQNVNGQNVLTPVATHHGGHITFSNSPTSNPSGLSMLIRPAVPKQTQAVLQHSPSATAQFLSPNGTANGTTSTGQQFVVNGATFAGGQLNPLVTPGINSRAVGPVNGSGEYGQTTLMVPCTPVSNNGGNTYVHQNTTIVQQQTTMVTNNQQPSSTPRNGNSQLNLGPATGQQTTTLNVNLNEQNQFIISDKSLILQAQAQLQHQQQQQQQMQQARQQLNINQTMNLFSQAAQAQYRQSVSTQTITGLQQIPTTVTTPNTFCQTSNAIASSLSTSSIVTGGPPHASSTPPTPGSPPDTTTLSPRASQRNSKDNVIGQLIGTNGTTISTSSLSNIPTNSSASSFSMGGGQSPMPGADTTTYSTGSGHSTDDGLSPAPSSCSSVGGGSNGSYAVSSGTPLAVGSAPNRQQQQNGTMAMVQCVSSSEPDISEFTFIDELDWTKSSFTVQNQNANQYNQRHNKKSQRNVDLSIYPENASFKIEKEIKSNDGRRSYSNSTIPKSSMELLQYGNNQQKQNQRQTTTLNYPESASTVQYVTGTSAYDTTETIIVQNNYSDNLSRNTQQRAFNSNEQTASTVILDHIGGSYANNIVDELLKQQQLEALQSKQHQQKDALLKNNTRNKYEKLHQHQEQRRKQQQINNIRQTIAALFDDDDNDSNNEVSTTKDTIQSAIDSVLSEETTHLDDSEPDNKLDTIAARSFAVGDLIWAPAHGCPAWPGQIIADDIDNGTEYMLVRWFGDAGTVTTSSVAAQTLCTLTQGLELHHLARKRARTSRKLNSQLEKAIQQAMVELDKLSDKTVGKRITSPSITDGSSIIKEKKTSEKTKKGTIKLSTNKDMTTVKKSSSRLRSQK